MLTPYSVVWSMLGALSLGYLGVAVFEPTLLAGMLPSAERQSADTDAKVSNLSDDVADLRSSIGQLRDSVDNIRSEVTSQAAHTQALDTHVSALEEKFNQTQTSASTATEPATPMASDAQPAMDAQPDAPAPSITKSAAQATKVINSTPAQIETGSVNSDGGGAAINFGPAVVKPAAKPIGLLIGSGPTVDGLRLSWTQLSDRNDKLKKLKPRYSENGDFKNPNFNLMAGPVKSKPEAIKICKELVAQGESCKVSEFKGEEL